MTGSDLTIVMPVHNEEDAIAPVVRSWADELDRLDIDYALLVYDDGSTDRTRQRLANLAAVIERLVVVEQSNVGHGPAVMRGYSEARSEWVFQTDSDGELGPAEFETLWRQRHAHDFLIGARRGRTLSIPRRGMSLAAHWIVRAAFSGGSSRPPRDVNCPYRLMRRDALVDLLPYVEPGSFAPNVALSGLAGASGLRIHEVPIANRPRTAGTSSLRPCYRLVRVSMKSMRETLQAAKRFRQRHRRAPGT